jgi:hypothetical protein
VNAVRADVRGEAAVMRSNQSHTSRTLEGIHTTRLDDMPGEPCRSAGIERRFCGTDSTDSSLFSAPAHTRCTSQAHRQC